MFKVKVMVSLNINELGARGILLLSHPNPTATSRAVYFDRSAFENMFSIKFTHPFYALGNFEELEISLLTHKQWGNTLGTTNTIPKTLLVMEPSQSFSKDEIDTYVPILTLCFCFLSRISHSSHFDFL